MGMYTSSIVCDFWKSLNMIIPYKRHNLTDDFLSCSADMKTPKTALHSPIDVVLIYDI